MISAEYTITDLNKRIYNFAFDYLKKKYVKVSSKNITTGVVTDYTYGVHYVVVDKTIELLQSVGAVGDVLRIVRKTSTSEQIVSWNDASILKASDMSLAQLQQLHILEEYGEYISTYSLSLDINGQYDAKNSRIVNLLAPQTATDAVNRGYIDSFIGTLTDAQSWAIGDIINRPEGSSKHWAEQAKNYIDDYYGFNLNVLLESTGYGIIRGGNVAVSNMTATVNELVVHMPDGKRCERAQTAITIQTADATNPRIDLIYLSSTGVVNYLAGTPASMPIAPTLPDGALALATISVLANATTGTITDTRIFKPRYQNTGIVNVKDFGAVCDGVTDDTTAITTAINYAIINNKPIMSFINECNFNKSMSISKSLKIIGTNEERYRLSGLDKGNIVKNQLANIFTGKASGSIVVVGDSITQGVGATDISKGYAGILADRLNANQNGGYHYESITQFRVLPSDITISGTVSVGTNGPVKQSLILQPGAVITINRDLTYLDVFYTQDTSAGSLHFNKNGTLYRTFLCAGTTELNKTSFNGAHLQTSGRDTYTITCVGNPVEITALLTLRRNETSSTVFRCGVSGYTSGDFINPIQTNAISALAKFFICPKGVIFLNIGTNDIYSVDNSVSPNQFKTNMATILNALNGHYICLSVPPIANSSVFPAVKAHHAKYKEIIYGLALQYDLPVVDFSSIDFIGKGLYTDGVHPNDAGHYEMARYICETMGVSFNTTINKYMTTEFLNGLKKTITIPLTSFSTNGVISEYSIPLSSDSKVLGIYIKNNTNGLVVNYSDYTDYANSCGLYFMRAYNNDYTTAKLYYTNVGGFCKTGRGPLGTFTTNTASNADIIIEYI